MSSEGEVLDVSGTRLKFGFWYRGRRPFGYRGPNDEKDKQLEAGELIKLSDLGASPRRLEQFIRLGYIAENDERVFGPPKACRLCGRRFFDLMTLNGHGARSHIEEQRKLTPQQEDARQEREEAVLDATAPLYLDKTAGQRK